MNALVSRLSEFDFIVMVDVSGSMSEEDAPGGRSRYDYMQETVESFVRDLEKLDSDGIGLVIFGNNDITVKDGVKASSVKEVFATRSPRGGTPTAEALTEALKLAGKSEKKDFIVVFTDGVPDDSKAVETVIRNQANAQESDDALTILFIQVGNDAKATASLKKLDDDLKGAKFDIVDVKTIEEANAFATTAELIEAAIVG